MKLKYDPELRERKKQLAMKRTLLRYHTDPELKEKVNKRRQELYSKKRAIESSKSLSITSSGENVVTLN